MWSMDELYMRKSWWRMGERVGYSVRMWRRVQLPMVARLLGFSRKRLRSTSMWLVSSSEGLICIDLKEEAWIAWLVDLRHRCG